MSTRTRVDGLEDCAARQTARITNLEDQRCNSNGVIHARLSVLEGLHPEVPGGHWCGPPRVSLGDRAKQAVAGMGGEDWRSEVKELEATIVKLGDYVKDQRVEVERLGNELFAAHIDGSQPNKIAELERVIEGLASDNVLLERKVQVRTAENMGLKAEVFIERRACKAAEDKLAKIHAAAKSNRSCNHYLNCGCLTCRMYRMSAPP